MCRPSVWAWYGHVMLCVILLTAGTAAAEPVVVFPTPGDVPLCLIPMREPSEDGQLLVGTASGRIARLDSTTGKPRAVWQAAADGGILALLELTLPGRGDRCVVASTATGGVVCFRGNEAEPAWRFVSTCEVSTLAEMPDMDGDATAEVVAGGADQRVHLLSGRTGREIWAHRFESKEGDTNVMGVLIAPDHDRDGTPDVAVWLWNGELAVLSGRTGGPIWRKPIGGGFTEAFALAPDLNGDGLGELLVGGNDCTVRACSGRDGAVLWSGRLDRPIRGVAVDSARSAARDRGGSGPSSASGVVAYACTAGGEVACFDLQEQAAPGTPRWTTNLGDVCRAVIVALDVDGDGTPDPASCAENGAVAVLSGRTGTIVRRWQVDDVARALCPVATDGSSHLAVASLDAAVHLLPAVQEAAAAGHARVRTTQPAPAPRSTLRCDDRQPGGAARPAGEAGPSGSPRVIILLYHDILPEVFNHYGTSVERFRTHMDMLVREKYVCVSLDEIADWIEGKVDMPDRAVCITFDGQYQGQYTYARPILGERGFFATSYITTDWIGTPDHSDWDQIREMDAAGVLDVQNHTINHPYLTRCDRSEVVRQLEECNQAIARHMSGKTSRHHAYPAGAHNKELRQIVRELGFRTATTVRPGPVTRDDDPLNLPRYMLCTHKTMEQFQAWLTGEESASATQTGRGAGGR